MDGWAMVAGWLGGVEAETGGGPGRQDPGASAHLLEKQWAADTTQQVWMRLPAQKLSPM